MQGESGECGRFLLNPETEEQQTLKSKTSNFKINKGDILRIETAGGGGFGPPLRRDLDYVLQDIISEKISNKEAQEQYGVVLTAKHTINEELTSKLRKQMSKRRKD